MRDTYLITGGAGFIGTNLADHYLTHGKRVTLLDNFSRPGAEENVRWLRHRHGEQLRVVRADVRHADAITPALVEEADVVVHLAGQVAVTTSLLEPRRDFETNALGTLNVLEAVRLSSSKPIVVYSSSNKVYGEMADLAVVDTGSRYAYRDCTHGIAETRPLDFHSPYGCSKGTADRYVGEYARMYGLRTIVFRQSCIYGPHQFGVEDQGWVAWFVIRAVQQLPLRVYGDGKQVRDVLHVDDLIAAYDAAVERIGGTAGVAYNIGGGPHNSLSLLELIDLLAQQLGRRLEFTFDAWRPGDQLVFISDIRKAATDFGWRPRVTAVDGLATLVAWVRANRDLLQAS